MSPEHMKAGDEAGDEAGETVDGSEIVEASEASEASEATEAAETTAAPETPAANETCPWCSAAVSASASTCPSCGASLRDAVDEDILGVTQIDPSAVSRASRIKPGRIATLLGAENTEDPTDLGGHVEPASKEVREEMLRLELAAIDAEIEARQQAVEAEKKLQDEASPEAEPS
jgi:hypothetical protein